TFCKQILICLQIYRKALAKVAIHRPLCIATWWLGPEGVVDCHHDAVLRKEFARQTAACVAMLGATAPPPQVRLLNPPFDSIGPKFSGIGKPSAISLNSSARQEKVGCIFDPRRPTTSNVSLVRVFHKALTAKRTARPAGPGELPYGRSQGCEQSGRPYG